MDAPTAPVVFRAPGWPRLAIAICALAVAVPVAGAGRPQEANPPRLIAGRISGELRIDGVLDEAAWQRAEAIGNLTMVEPTEGGTPTGRTVVRVLADARTLVIGVRCDDPDPTGIVSFTKQRDGSMSSEDHVEIALDTFMDGRSGYTFSVNPGGARYDALINPGGDEVNSSWDGIWEAAARRDSGGWSAEIRIPIRTLSFRKGLETWHLNVERRIQRLQETDRWASPSRDYKVTQMSRAGVLAGLPAFDLGAGLALRPAAVAGGGVPARGAPAEGDAHASLDVTQRLGPNLLASASVNTDFAETEVDTRQTNLTRFSLYFPEKRAFFLEGADIFQFGLGLGSDVVPFFSRRIGLVGGEPVPILLAGKLNGRVGNTNLGVVAGRTRETDGVAAATAMGAARVQQNVLGESSVGAIVTVGDPLGRRGSWLGGADFTYQTSHFRRDKNFAVGVWGLKMGRQGLGGDRTAAGFTVSYPNDLWDVTLAVRRVGEAFDPSLGFVPRPGIYSYTLNGEFDPRPDFWHIRQMFNEFRLSRETNLRGRWETYRVFTAPVNWRFESGDRVEFNWAPAGENLPEPFEIADGVVLAPGPYHWTRWRLEAGTAAKRRLSAQATWWFGSFYDGRLDQFLLTASWNPTPLVTVSFSGERDVGRLPSGDFVETLARTGLRLNVSPDLQVNSLVQYRYRRALARHEHAAAVDARSRRGSLRRLQSQPARRRCWALGP